MASAFLPGLGMQEILLLGLCFMTVVVPIVIVFIVLRFNRKQNSDVERSHGGSNPKAQERQRIDDLEAENRRLRKKLSEYEHE